MALLDTGLASTNFTLVTPRSVIFVGALKYFAPKIRNAIATR